MYHYGIAERRGMRDGDFFTGSESQVEKPLAVFVRSIQSFDPKPAIEGNRG